MNSKRQLVIKFAAAAVALSFLFPPFAEYLLSGAVNGVGFGFILSWPEGRQVTAVIHTPTLLLEWLAIAAIARLLWVLLRNPDEKSFIQAIIDDYIALKKEELNTRADVELRIAEIQAEAAESKPSANRIY